MAIGATIWINDSNRQAKPTPAYHDQTDTESESIYSDEEALWDLTMSLENRHYDEWDDIIYDAVLIDTAGNDDEPKMILKSAFSSDFIV